MKMIYSDLDKQIIQNGNDIWKRVANMTQAEDLSEGDVENLIISLDACVVFSKHLRKKYEKIYDLSSQ